MTTNNGKVAIRYQPASFVTFRGAASTGFRAPTLFNLYSPNFLAASTSGNMGANNPFCAPGKYTQEWTQAVCNTQGLGLYGGNSPSAAETSENFDLGVILAPVKNMGISLDYYRILLKNTIGQIPAADDLPKPDRIRQQHRDQRQRNAHSNDRGVRSIAIPFRLRPADTSC